VIAGKAIAAGDEKVEPLPLDEALLLPPPPHEASVNAVIVRRAVKRRKVI
jgi:hypothetical protein